MNLDDEYDEQLEKDRGECLGYVKNDCNYCGRQRVEKWSNGQEICEKCLRDQSTGEWQQDLRL